MDGRCYCLTRNGLMARVRDRAVPIPVPCARRCSDTLARANCSAVWALFSATWRQGGVLDHDQGRSTPSNSCRFTRLALVGDAEAFQLANDNEADEARCRQTLLAGGEVQT